MDTNVIKQLEAQAKQVIERFDGEVKKLRTGRAHPSMVEDVVAEAYDTTMPLKQLATITTPEAQLIQISPFDPNTIEAIATAIRNNQTLGFNPSDDGRVVRIQVPALTAERRQQIVKQLGEKLEEAHIGIRKARHDAIDAVNKAKKDKDIGEDDAKRLQKDIDEAVNNAKEALESSAKAKEQEILTL